MILLANGEMAAGLVLAGVIGGLVTKGADALIRVMKSRREGKQADRKDAIDEWREFSRKQEEQGERNMAVIRQQQLAVEAVWRSDAQCRASLAEARTCIRFLYDLLKRFHGKLCEVGHDPGNLPDLPTMTDPPSAIDAEFLARQAAQSAELVQKASGVIAATPKPAGT